MKAARRKLSAAVKDGQAAGLWLAEQAADVMLNRFTNRPSNGKGSRSSQRWSDAWDVLREVLGPRANDPDIVAALHELDEAHGDACVEHEDCAWHAAWITAASLCKPRTAPTAPRT